MATPSAANWQFWLAEHGARLLLFARTQSRCEADVEDLLQDALMEASQKCGGWPPDLPRVYATLPDGRLTWPAAPTAGAHPRANQRAARGAISHPRDHLLNLNKTQK